MRQVLSQALSILGTPDHLNTALGGRGCWDYFSEGETEVQKSEVTCLRPLS